MKKFSIHCVISVVAFIFFDFIIGALLNKLVLSTNDKAVVAYNNHFDIALMGASEMNNQYVSRIIADSLGVTTYNFGSDGQNIYYQYALLNLMISHAPQKPKWIVIEVSEIDFYNTPKWNTEKLNILYPMIELDDSLRTIVVRDWKENIMLRTIKCYKHNSKILTYLRTYLREKEGFAGIKEDLGYLPIEPVVFNVDLKTIVGKNEEDRFDNNKLEYWYRFIRLCKQEGINLIVVNAPYYQYHENIAWLEKAKLLFASESIPFFNYDNDEYYLAHPEWYYNVVHFNKIGALEYTKRIIHDLRTVIDIQDN